VRLRRLGAFAALCGTVGFVWAASQLFGFGPPRAGDTEAPMQISSPPAANAEPIAHPRATAMDEGGASANAAAIVQTPSPSPDPQPLPDPIDPRRAAAIDENASLGTDPAIVEAAALNPRPMPAPATPVEQATSVMTPDTVQIYPVEPNITLEIPDERLLQEVCVDRYLWSVYERAPKEDTIRVSERKKVTVKKKGKTQTITKTVMKLVDEDFTWKDPKAAQKAGMSMMDYVIGGMDRSFKLKLYRALRAMDDAGLAPGITSGFRDDYRQSLASGNKAATDSSYHGGSRRGGYGHGLAADIVSVKGETRVQRWLSSEKLWRWIDEHGNEFGIGRPYLDRDPPHVGPIDGKEYADKRGLRNAERAGSGTSASHRSAVRGDHNKTKRGKTASSKV
jgi:hypothetical protein